MLQRTAPGGSALQSSEKLAHLYQTAPGSVKAQIGRTEFHPATTKEKMI